MNVFESDGLMDALFPQVSAEDITVVLDGSETSNSGKAGSSIRMKERTPIVTLTEAEKNKYLSNIDGKTLYWSPETIPYLTAEEIFGSSGSISWDLGSGRGERIVELAKQQPERKFVGVDIHGRSASIGARAAADAMLDNVHFIRADTRLLMQKIPSDSADEVAVLFPAPQPNPNGTFGDLLQPTLSRQIAQILEDTGTFEFATDSAPYFSVKMRMIGSLGLFRCTLEDITIESKPHGDTDSVRTRYQNLWESKGIITQRAKLRTVSSNDQ